MSMRQEGQVTDFFCGRNHTANFSTQEGLNHHLKEVHLIDSENQNLPQNYNLEGSNDSKTPNPINTYNEFLALINERDIGCGKNCQSAYGALRAALELVKPYLEHDIKNVTKVDGVYDKEQAEAWEKVHGHDIRLNCYPEFGCQLLIDPEDLFLTLIEQLGMSDE